MTDAKSYLRTVDLEVGMNFPLWDRDRRGYGTTVEHTTGGVGAMFGDHAGAEVGQNYQSGMGTERNEPTYVSSNTIFSLPNPPGMGKGSRSGKISPAAPQVYTK